MARKWSEDQKDSEEDIQNFIVTRLNTVLTDIHSLLGDLEKRKSGECLKKRDFDKILGCYDLADEILYATQSLVKYFKENKTMLFIDKEACRLWCESQRKSL